MTPIQTAPHFIFDHPMMLFRVPKFSSLTLFVLFFFIAFSQPERPLLSQEVVSPKLVICGGGTMPDKVFQAFRKLAAPEPKLVIIPTASSRKIDETAVKELWKQRGFPNVTILHSTDRKVANTKEFVKPLERATAVWFGGGSQQRIADAYFGTLVEKEVHRILKRGGVVGGTSAGAAIQSKVMIAAGRTEPKISVGFDLLPGTIIDQHFLKRNRLPRLTAAVRTHPKLIGIGIDEGTAVVVQGNQLNAVGRSYVLRIQSESGRISIDAFGNGDTWKKQ